VSDSRDLWLTLPGLAMLACSVFGAVAGVVSLTAPSPTAESSVVVNPDPFVEEARLVKALIDLKIALNNEFGFLNGHPRVSMGPCGELAREFHDSWNERFTIPCRIAFIKILNDQVCRHVLIRLPDGTYFDAGRGVMEESELTRLYREVNGEDDESMHIEVMATFDEAEFKANTVSGPYPDCPGYSSTAARRLIDNHLGRVALAARVMAVDHHAEISNQ
jgi:hypothetical protein